MVCLFILRLISDFETIALCLVGGGGVNIVCLNVFPIG